MIEVGGATETVDVTAEAPLIQASSGERSFTVATSSVENLPRYSQLQSLGSGGLTTQGPPFLVVFKYDSKLPSSYQWNGGVQFAFPWSLSGDVSYVGQHGFNLLQNVDINGVDFGTAYTIDRCFLTAALPV